ncbi:antitoxin [Rothia sp. ARF10]|nr:antitoxin [Rothia sp. ARF10]
MARGVIKLAALAGLAKQAREYARKNPDSVSSAIGKVESAVGRKVGPKYAGHVGKGGNALRSGLGISSARPVTGGTTTAHDDLTSRTDGTTPPPPPPV